MAAVSILKDTRMPSDSRTDEVFTGQILSRGRNRRPYRAGRRRQEKQDRKREEMQEVWTSSLGQAEVSAQTLLRQEQFQSNSDFIDKQSSDSTGLQADEVTSEPIEENTPLPPLMREHRIAALLLRDETLDFLDAIERGEPDAVLSLLIQSEETLQIFATLVSAGLIAIKGGIFILTPQAKEYRQDVLREKNATAASLLETQTSQWLMHHLSELQEQYAGQWVAIVEDQVMLSAATLPELLENVRKAQIHRPLITQIPVGPILWDTAYAG